MYTIYLREIRNFLSSLVAYIVMAVFLLITGLFIWIFPENNILDFGYANLDPLFFMAPWVFMFLVPAVTMRAFSEEKKTGTIELLFTKPLTDLEIILGKFFAGLSLVLLALAPTLLYYYSIYKLGDPVGNIDTGATIGSYIGLFLLGAAYVSIGLFASAITDNQIVAFILAVFICFFFYAAFGSLSIFGISNIVTLFIEQMGIQYHYASISKGVIDTRDVLYFFSLAAAFIMATKTALSSRNW
jgi:ABC-2 type transport system permease protein